MADSKRIGMRLFSDDLIKFITIKNKILPMDYSNVVDNVNPNNYQYGRIASGEHKGEMYYWSEYESRWLVFHAVDNTKYTKEEINAMVNDLQIAMGEHSEFYEQAKLDEITRQEYEEMRIDNENIRKQNEELRQSEYAQIKEIVDDVYSSEDERKQSESVRVSNEESRVASDVIRASKDAEFNSNEEIRKANEITRESNEEIRIQNEKDREERFNQLIISDSPQEIVDARGSFSTLRDRLDNIDNVKVDVVAGKQLSTEDFTTDEKNKLANIEDGANNYKLPSTLPSSMIIDNPDKRFVSDSKISEWDAKETVEGAQDKANHAEMNAYAYIDDEIDRLDSKINIPEKVEFSGYGPIIPIHDAATNGQINMSVKGETRTNILGDLGNFEDLSLWEQYIGVSGGIVTEDSSVKLFGNKSVKFNMKGGNIHSYVEVENLDVNKYYEASVYFYISSHIDGYIRIYLSDIGGFSNPILGYAEKDKINQWQRVNVKFTGRDAIRFSVNCLNGTQVVNFDGAMLREITEEEYDYTNRPIKYIEGTKSTIAAMKIKSVGKNLFDGNLVQENEHGSNFKINAIAEKYIPILPQTNYFAKCSFSLPGMYFHWYDSGKNIIKTDKKYNTDFIVVISPNNAKYAKVMLYDNEGVDIPTIKMIVGQADTPTEYESYKESTAYVVAKDKDNKIVNLMSHEGVHDEIDLDKRELIKRIGVDEEGLTYQLAEPEHIPIQWTGLNGYKGGQIEISNVFPEVGFYYNDKLVSHYPDYPIGKVTELYKVDKETGLRMRLDHNKCVISTDKLSFTHPDLSNGDLCDWDYKTIEEYPLPKCTFTADVNLSSSVESLLKDSETKKEIIRQLESGLYAHKNDGDIHTTIEEKNNLKDRLTANEDSISDQGAILNKHTVDTSNPHKVTASQVGAISQNMFASHTGNDVVHVTQEERDIVVTQLSNSYNGLVEQKAAMDDHLDGNYGKLFHIIESGGDENGEYVKFSDGRMVCWIGNFRLSQLGIDNYYITDVWTFPKSFIEPPVVFPVGEGLYTTAEFASLIVGYSSTTETTTRINAWKRDSGKIAETDRTKGVNIMAIGRWRQEVIE